MIGICYVGSGMKYHSLSYWPIVMMSPQQVNFAPNRYEKSIKMAQPTRKKTNKGLLESL